MSYLPKLHHPAFTRVSDGGKMPNTIGWQDRHIAAIREPRGPEGAIIGLIAAWASYADTHKARYESGIGQDGVLGPAWQAIGENIRTLLNGECGRFDCGTLDGFLCDTLYAEGYPQ